MRHAHLRKELYEHRVGPVIFRPPLHRHPPRHLKLHHKAQFREEIRLLQQPQYEGRSDVVGKVRDELVRPWVERRVVEGQGIPLVDEDVPVGF
jgi:hypothetical protein